MEINENLVYENMI